MSYQVCGVLFFMEISCIYKWMVILITKEETNIFNVKNSKYEK